ncbi:hypothetical protein [Paenibacillus alvei]|uniref:hypothetical protein n=1 Tax=Paenibacillus alvei TaxID=44250 RepID=UPI001267FBFC|nr:hypothetical protein [Paenibacillus alvei]
MLDHEGKLALTPRQQGEAETMFLNYHHQWSEIPSLGQVATTLSSIFVSRDCCFLALKMVA